MSQSRMGIVPVFNIDLCSAEYSFKCTILNPIIYEGVERVSCI